MAKKRFLLGNLLALIILGWVLAACTDDSSPMPTPTFPVPPSPAGSSSNPAPVVVAPPVTTATASTGFPYDCHKLFCFGLAQEPVGIIQGWFDPANLVDQPSLQICYQIYETLFQFQSPSMEVKPASLLKTAPKVSADGLTYSFRVGKGLRFSDDTSLDASAVKFNFDRWSDPGNLYHKGDFQTWATYFGGFPGNLASITADDPNNTVILKLKQPMANLYQILAMPQFAIVAPSSFNPQSGQMEHSYGSNLYAITGKPVHSDTKYVALNANKLFFLQRFDPKDPAAPVVKSEMVVAVVLQQKQEGLSELRDGDIAATDKIPPEQVPDARKDIAIQLLERPALNVSFLGMNMLKPPFDNLIIRQAFAAGINTPKLVRDYYNSLGEPATDLLPPAVVNRPTPSNAYNYDPDLARQQLAVFGYTPANPLKIDLWVLPVPRSYYPDPHKIANAITADLGQIGVVVTVQDSKEWPEFYKDRLAGNLDFYMFGWQGSNGDPDEFLGEFYGQQRGEGGYENQTLLNLIQGGETALDPAARPAMYQQAQAILNGQTTILPLAYTKSVVAVRSNVKGYVASPTGLESWASVEFTPAVK